ncbi:MAG: hypothetical protein ACRCW2_00630 [Cellulosilyticaceae bacterium]
MFNKKQFLTVLLSAVIVFAIVFTIVYTVFYKNGIEHPIVQPEATVPVVAQEQPEVESDVQPVEATASEMVRVGPQTHVFLKLVDPNGERLSEQKLIPDSLLGFTQEQVEACFADYKITVFNQDEVVLEKVMVAPQMASHYRLALQGEMIGIKTITGETQVFHSLGLSIKDFSQTTHVLLLDEAIEISSTQKAALERNPYEIEQILQDYSE